MATRDTTGESTSGKSPAGGEDLLDDLARVADQLGRSPTTSEYDTEGEWHYTTLIHRFDGWETALEKAGLDPDEREFNNVGPGIQISEADLIEELQAAAAALGRPPSSSEMNAYGEYSAGAYYYRFGGWPEALDAAGLDADQSSSHDGGDRSGKTWFEQLDDDGPLSSDTIPKITVGMRQKGARRFNLHVGKGRSKTIFYVEDEHEPKTVIKTWLEVNQDAAERSSNHALHTGICEYGDEWKEASRELFDLNTDYNDAGNGGSGVWTSECPFCGEGLDEHLPEHLPCNGSGE